MGRAKVEGNSVIRSHPHPHPLQAIREGLEAGDG